MMERTKSAQQSSQSLISSFFGHQPKKPRTDSGVPVTADFTETTQDAVHTEKASTSSLAPDTSLTPDCQVTPGSKGILTNDIGNFIGKDIDDYTKMSLLEHPWSPPENYSFPFSQRTVSGKLVKNYIKRIHLDTHKEWLVYSDARKGLFCKYCPWFTNRNEGGFCKNVALKALVTEPLTNFKKLTGATGDLLNHCNTQYHKDAVTAGKNFLTTYHCPKKDVCNLINEDRLVQARQNREKLIPIIKTVILSGRQNFPFRGHRDDGPICLESPVSSEGNFKALLRFRVDAGDKVLEKHLNTASSRSTYVSKTIQNQIINCCKEEITEVILSRVSQAGLYSIIFDETTDSSNKAQVSLVLRYVRFGKEVQIREDFITFVDAFAEMMSADIMDVDTQIARTLATRRRLSQGPIGEGSAGAAAAAAVYYFRPRGHSVVFVLTCLYPNGVLLRFYFGLRTLAWRFASQVRTQPPY
ncbi:hypothetical protein JTE90_020437 [Oedothorax gibbosus]|uniref:DUF4371 domain-containing protein n=1 Tax=Oedothorax gibbosus TaxID=931172 RepID=A0AAV6U0U2_9ARAC|nr:hypothetical protein JTE90_020437 [Oedothorax gibbosus]